MKNGLTPQGSKFFFTLIALATISTTAAFAGTLIPISDGGGRINILPIGPISGGGGGNNIDAERDWANTGTDFNTTTSWTGGVVPTTGDVAWFKAAEITNPN